MAPRLVVGGGLGAVLDTGANGGGSYECRWSIPGIRSELGRNSFGSNFEL